MRTPIRHPEFRRHLLCAGDVFVGYVRIYGIGGRTRLNGICLGLGITGLLAYTVTGNGLLAVTFGILADVVGYIPTFVKTFKDPTSEDPVFFALEGAASFLAVLAVGSAEIGIVFPIYFVLSSTIVLVLIYRDRLGLGDVQR